MVDHQACFSSHEPLTADHFVVSPVPHLFLFAGLIIWRYCYWILQEYHSFVPVKYFFLQLETIRKILIRYFNLNTPNGTLLLMAITTLPAVVFYVLHLGLQKRVPCYGTPFCFFYLYIPDRRTIQKLCRPLTRWPNSLGSVSFVSHPWFLLTRSFTDIYFNLICCLFMLALFPVKGVEVCASPSEQSVSSRSIFFSTTSRSKSYWDNLPNNINHLPLGSWWLQTPWVAYTEVFSLVSFHLAFILLPLLYTLKPSMGSLADVISRSCLVLTQKWIPLSTEDLSSTSTWPCTQGLIKIGIFIFGSYSSATSLLHSWPSLCITF